MSCKSASFYIKTENLEYIDDQIKNKPRYNKSNWLDDLVDHLRSKAKPPAEAKKPVKRFAKPDLDQVRIYFLVRDSTIIESEHEKFFDFYESKNWMVGKNKMKDWKAAVRNWMRGNKPSGPPTDDNWDDDNWHKDLGM